MRARAWALSGDNSQLIVPTSSDEEMRRNG